MILSPYVWFFYLPRVPDVQEKKSKEKEEEEEQRQGEEEETEKHEEGEGNIFPHFLRPETLKHLDVSPALQDMKNMKEREVEHRLPTDVSESGGT